MLRRRFDFAVQTVGFIIRARGEEERVGRLTPDTVAERNSPKTIDLQHASAGVAQLPGKVVWTQVVGVDRSVAEIADQQMIAERPEPRWRQRHAPGCIEFAA